MEFIQVKCRNLKNWLEVRKNKNINENHFTPG